MFLCFSIRSSSIKTKWKSLSTSLNFSICFKSLYANFYSVNYKFNSTIFCTILNIALVPIQVFEFLYSSQVPTKHFANKRSFEKVCQPSYIQAFATSIRISSCPIIIFIFNLLDQYVLNLNPNSLNKPTLSIILWVIRFAPFIYEFI